MDNEFCQLNDRRKNKCPVAEEIAKDAAEKAIKGAFAKIGYDLDDERNVVELVLLFDFLKKLSCYSSRGKMAMFIALLVSITGGITALVVAFFSSGANS